MVNISLQTTVLYPNKYTITNKNPQTYFSALFGVYARLWMCGLGLRSNDIGVPMIAHVKCKGCFSQHILIRL